MANPYGAMEAREDPYYVVRNGVSGDVDLLRMKHQDYQSQLQDKNVATDRTLKGLRRAILRDLRKMDGKVKDLELSVQMVESNRAGFEHIDDHELASRRNFIAEHRRLLQSMREDVDGTGYRERYAADEAQAARSMAPNDTYGATTDAERGHSSFVNEQRSLTQVRLAEQDDTLVELSEGVDRVGRMAGSIHQELGEQNRMLTAFETDMDRAEEEMGLMLGKVAKLLKTKDRCQIFTVVLLTLIIICLFFAVIYG